MRLTGRAWALIGATVGVAVTVVARWVVEAQGVAVDRAARVAVAASNRDPVPGAIAGGFDPGWFWGAGFAAGVLVVGLAWLAVSVARGRRRA